MKNEMLEQLKKSIIMHLTHQYGYCGCAESDNQAVLNSGGEGENFVITIKDAGHTLYHEGHEGNEERF